MNSLKQFGKSIDTSRFDTVLSPQTLRLTNDEIIIGLNVVRECIDTLSTQSLKHFRIGDLKEIDTRLNELGSQINEDPFLNELFQELQQDVSALRLSVKQYSNQSKQDKKVGIELQSNTDDSKNLEEQMFQGKIVELIVGFEDLQQMSNESARLALNNLIKICLGLERIVSRSKVSKELKLKYLGDLSDIYMTLHEKRIVLLEEYSKLLNEEKKVAQNNTLLRIKHNEKCSLAIVSISGIIKSNLNLSELERQRLLELKEAFKLAKI
jgi:hypothetical protein